MRAKTCARPTPSTWRSMPHSRRALDGGEEHACAVAIDAHAKVKHWVRNLDSDPVAGFWLPTSAGRFYPDFVCELIDGRVFVAEYKGEHLRPVPKEIEKDQVGRVWAAA